MKQTDSEFVVDISELVFPELSPFSLFLKINNQSLSELPADECYPAMLMLGGKPILDSLRITFVQNTSEIFNDQPDCYQFPIMAAWRKSLCQVLRHRLTSVVTLAREFDNVDTRKSELIMCLPLGVDVFLEQQSNDDVSFSEVQDIVSHYSKDPLWQALTNSLLEIKAESVEEKNVFDAGPTVILKR